jgi:hypothetical protein
MSLRELSMRQIVGLLSVMPIFFAINSLHAGEISIEGSWVGSGTVGYRGTIDQVRCQVRYTRSSEISYSVSSVCATDKESYEINGRVTNTGGDRYRGPVTWGNDSGRLVLIHRGNEQSITVTSRSRGSAKLTLSRH